MTSSPDLVTSSQAILGAPLRHAKRLGIDTPTLETIWALLSAIDARNSGKIKALL